GRSARVKAKAGGRSDRAMLAMALDCIVLASGDDNPIREQGNLMRIRRWFITVRSIAAFAGAICSVAYAASVSPVSGEDGMVATAPQLATKDGRAVPTRGGETGDAAVGARSA